LRPNFPYVQSRAAELTRKTETTFTRVVVHLIASTQLIDTQIDIVTDIIALGSSAANLLVTREIYMLDSTSLLTVRNK